MTKKQQQDRIDYLNEILPIMAEVEFDSNLETETDRLAYEKDIERLKKERQYLMLTPNDKLEIDVPLGYAVVAVEQYYDGGCGDIKYLGTYKDKDLAEDCAAYTENEFYKSDNKLSSLVVSVVKLEEPI